VEICEVREEAWERVRLFHVGIRRLFVQQGDGEIEVGKGNGRERLDQNVDDNIGII